ncbi:MAG: phosphatase PAP2 family protein, partial [Oenococcus sp.]
VMTVILLLFVLTVCFSRIYLEAHYLSDVVSGAALAFSWIIFMRHIYNKFAEKLLLAKMFR